MKAIREFPTASVLAPEDLTKLELSVAVHGAKKRNSIPLPFCSFLAVHSFGEGDVSTGSVLPSYSVSCADLP